MPGMVRKQFPWCAKYTEKQLRGGAGERGGMDADENTVVNFMCHFGPWSFQIFRQIFWDFLPGLLG